MQYTIPLTLNDAGEPDGVFSVNTSKGMLVIIFSNSIRWKAFADQVSPFLAKQGEKLGSTIIEAPSLEAVVKELEQMDPNITNEAIFVPDSTEMFADIVRYFESQSQS